MAFGGWIGQKVSQAGDAIADVGDAIANIAVDIWQGIALPVLEGAFNLLGYSDQEIIIVQVSSTRMIEDTPPDNMSNTIYRSIVRNSDIVVAVRQLLITGTLGSVSRYAQYGSTDYIDGLPSVSTTFSQTDYTAVNDVISAETGVTTTTTSVHVGYPSATFWAKYYLQNNEGYTEDDSIITVGGIDWVYDYALRDPLTKQVSVYLKKSVNATSIPYSVSTETQIGVTTSLHLLTFDRVATNTGVPADDEIYLSNVVIKETTLLTSSPSTGVSETHGSESHGYIGYGLVCETVITVSSAEINIGADVVAPVTQTRELGYTIAPPTPDSYYSVVYTKPSITYPFFWSYARSTNTYHTLGGNYYVAAQPGVDVLPIVTLRSDFTTITAGHPSFDTSVGIVNNLNFKFTDITDAIDGNADIAAIRDAFLVFSINLYTQTQSGIEALYDAFDIMYQTAPIGKIEYEDSLAKGYPDTNTFKVVEGTFNSITLFNYITVTDIVGVIGPQGTYTNIHSALDKSVDGYINSYVTIQKQYNDTNYLEMVIHGLVSIVGVTTVNNTLRTVITEISDDISEQTKFNLLIPRPSIEGYPYKVAEQIIYESMNLLIYASDKQNLKYYETAEFSNFIGIVMKVIAVAVLIVSLGSASSVSAGLWVMAQQVLYQYALALTLEQLLEYVDDDNLRLLLVAAYAYVAVKTGKSNSGTSTLEELLEAVSAVQKGSSIYIQSEYEQLQDDIDAFNVVKESAEEQIENAKAFLDTDSKMDIYSIYDTPADTVYESPTEFFTRTVGNLNPGVLLLADADTYIKASLMLPRLPNPNTR